ncbi:MAG: hypothetical protein B6245_24040 [Desulfobacteraceae bacterium 4572_88]|nr:MAG: hypothetical protein B6245_24040 [Desulfobacteraceae bacterium 4572_88]
MTSHQFAAIPLAGMSSIAAPRMIKTYRPNRAFKSLFLIETSFLLWVNKNILTNGRHSISKSAALRFINLSGTPDSRTAWPVSPAGARGR